MQAYGIKQEIASLRNHILELEKTNKEILDYVKAIHKKLEFMETKEKKND